MNIIRTVHDTTIIEGYVDEPEAEGQIERARVYNRAHPFYPASITFFNHGFNLGSWDSGNPDAENSREKFRIVYPLLLDPMNYAEE